MGAAAVPAIAFDGAPRALARLRANAWRPSRGRILVKLVGAVATIGSVAVIVATLPFFHRATLAPLVAHGPTILAIALMLFLVYAVVADGALDAPQDGLYALGAAALGRRCDERALVDFALTQAIKLYFFTLMLAFLADDIVDFRSLALSSWSLADPTVVDAANRAIFSLDVAISGMGYLATLQLCGWHVRAPERTLSGWVACVVCYEPVYPALATAVFAFDGGDDPGEVMGPGTIAFALWSGLTLLCNAVYLSATAALGPHFSNLTRRGIVTSGPYRLSKHPAYLAKNAGWWLYWLPAFVAAGWPEGGRRALMLAAVSAVYFARAKCEERMLSEDAAYRDYADVIHGRGALSRFSALLRRPRAA